jgi:hypothetical protein
MLLLEGRQDNDCAGPRIIMAGELPTSQLSHAVCVVSSHQLKVELISHNTEGKEVVSQRPQDARAGAQPSGSGHG